MQSDTVGLIGKDILQQIEWTPGWQMETPLADVRAKYALTINEVLRLVPWGRATLYDDIKSGHLKTFTRKGRRYATSDSVRKYVETIEESKEEKDFKALRDVNGKQKKPARG